MPTSMARSAYYFCCYCCLTSLFLPSNSTDCSNYTFFPSNRTFPSCTSLPVLSSHLHWNYSPAHATVDIAYRSPSSLGRWIAWAINPTRLSMLGSQALFAAHFSNGTIAAFTTPLNSYNPSMQPSQLSFDVQNMSAEYRDGEMIIFATVSLLQNRTVVNQVWQEGPVSDDGIPQIHATFGDNLDSVGNLDFVGEQGNGRGGRNLGVGSRRL